MARVHRFLPVLMVASGVILLTACGSAEGSKQKVELENIQMDQAAAEKKPEKESVEANQTAASVEAAKAETKIPESQEKPAAEGNTAEGNAVEEDAVEGDAASYYVQKYAEILDAYYDALKNQLGAEEYYAEERSALSTYCYEGNPLENVGFAFVDMDNDGGYELLLGAISGDEFVDKMVFEMYTLVDEKPVQIFCGQERDRYYLASEEAGGFFIVNEASAGAGFSAWYYYNMLDKQLNVVQAIIAETEGDSTAWYMTYDTDWDTSNDEAIEETFGKAVVESYENNYTLPEYIPFLYYK